MAQRSNSLRECLEKYREWWTTTVHYYEEDGPEEYIEWYGVATRRRRQDPVRDSNYVNFRYMGDYFILYGQPNIAYYGSSDEDSVEVYEQPD